MAQIISDALKYLQELSELQLQSQVVEPLLRKLRFYNVRDVSGANDQGKDLIALKKEFGKSKLYAIQIKKFKFSGKHSSPKALTFVLTQLRQIFGEQTFDLESGTKRHVDRCLFITPFTINKPALESAFDQLSRNERGEISIIDGPMLVDQVMELMPNFIAQINSDLHYRASIVNVAKRIEEATAFGTRQLVLDDVFVDINIEQGIHSIERIACSQLIADRIIIHRGGPSANGTLKGLESINNAFNEFVGCNISAIDYKLLPPKQKNSIDNKREQLKIEIKRERKRSRNDGFGRDSLSEGERELNIERETVEAFDLTPLLNCIRKKCKDLIANLNSTNFDKIEEQECKNLLNESKFLVYWINTIRYNPAYKAHFGNEIAGNRTQTMVVFLKGRHLLKFGMPVIVVGPPGAGKTTLMRKLVQTVAMANTSLMPILIHCNRIKSDGTKGLIVEATLAAQDLGWKGNDSKLRERIKSGNIRLFFDGLDEAGDRAFGILDAIKELAEIYPLSKPIVTARDTITWPEWESSFQVRLSSFTDSQQNEFVSNWFASSPSKRDKLLLWLRENEHMKEEARIPIIAALLCSLISVNAELPTTKLAMYEERFELLLGRWEQAKGIPYLPTPMRQRYLHFLMDLAISAHRSNVRNIAFEKVYSVAAKYVDTRYHSSASEIVDDCVRRGILLQEGANSMSFGHLTYQEFLVARWLHENHSASTIFRKLNNAWWKNVLQMYALRAKNLASLIDATMTTKLNEAEYGALWEMIGIADLTPIDSIRVLRERIRGETGIYLRMPRNLNSD